MYDFLLVVYSNLTVLEKFDVKQSNDLEISPRSSTVASRESCRVAIYVQEAQLLLGDRATRKHAKDS